MAKVYLLYNYNNDIINNISFSISYVNNFINKKL